MNIDDTETLCFSRTLAKVIKIDIFRSEYLWESNNKKNNNFKYAVLVFVHPFVCNISRNKSLRYYKTFCLMCDLM